MADKKLLNWEGKADTSWGDMAAAWQNPARAEGGRKGKEKLHHPPGPEG